MLVTLANMDPPPESVPINMLVRSPGTPLATAADFDALEFVRTVAAARIMMPGSMVRLSAGRLEMDVAMQGVVLPCRCQRDLPRREAADDPKPRRGGR